ncbi:MAG TPA: UDP-glucuronic acid decarboxylase family protein [Gemmatirosa sp.]
MTPTATPAGPLHVLITGAAGFVPSHVCDRLLSEGHRIVGVDNFLTGTPRNVAHLDGERGFALVEGDVSAPGALETTQVRVAVRAVLGDRIDAVMHLASPASPVDYYEHPLATLDVGSSGTRNAVSLAASHGARFLLASTSEVYGDPHVHPQPESYWGHVNPVGPRSCYDEAKRFAEAMTMTFQRTYGVDTRIVRIFNTYGPRMRPDDGRVVSNFCVQALRGAPITVYGDGEQTRSFTYVSDLVDGIVRLLLRPRADDSHLPTNVGNPGEFTIAELAALVLELTGSASAIDRRPLPADDPKQRKPDIARARATLGWEPRVPLREGLAQTLTYFRGAITEPGVLGGRVLPGQQRATAAV